MLLILRCEKNATIIEYIVITKAEIWNTAYNDCSKSIDMNFLKNAMLAAKVKADIVKVKIMKAQEMYARFFHLLVVSSGKQKQSHVITRRLDGKGSIDS